MKCNHIPVDEELELVRRLVPDCVDSIYPSAEDNMEYAVETLSRRSYIVIGPADPRRLVASIAVWNLFFPDHCCGDTVFFAAVLRLPLDIYKPVVLISCSHFEHGDAYPDLENLVSLLRVVATEVFDTAATMAYDIEVLDPYAEKLLVAVRTRGDEEPVFNNLADAARWIIRRLGARPARDEVDGQIGSFLETAVKG